MPLLASGRRLARAVLLGVARAGALAAAALVASAVEPDFRARFLLVWTAIFGLALVPVTLLEGAALRGTALSRSRRAALDAALGLAWGLLLLRFLPATRAIGPLAPAAIAAASLAAGAAIPPARPREGRRVPALAAAIILAIFAALFAIDPEARYAARYADNRRSALLVGEPVAEGDPAQLSDLDLARAIALAWMRAHRPARLRWSWEEAVAVDGLLAWGERTGDARPRAYARAWIAAHAEEALSAPLWADAAAPASAALAVSRGPGSVEEEIVARVAAYVREGAPRTRAGALSHPGALLGGAIPAQAWVDSLYMHGGFLVRLAAAREEPWAAEEARALAHAVVESLQDEGTGLFRHAAIDLGPLTIRLPVEPAFWARGNAWAAWFLTEHAIARRARDLPPDERTEAARVRLQSALLDRQDPESGLWRTELDGRDASNPVETSASALILASLRRSLAHDLAPDAPRAREAAARAARGLRACIRWVGGHPILTGVSTGTHPAHRAYYRAVPLDENVGHGVGAALLALTAS